MIFSDVLYLNMHIRSPPLTSMEVAPMQNSTAVTDIMKVPSFIVSQILPRNQTAQPSASVVERIYDCGTVRWVAQHGGRCRAFN